MQDIIKPIDRALLKAELTGDKKLRRTNKSNNEIYIITAHDSPNVMQEIGRLREIAFRYYGGGTGFSGRYRRIRYDGRRLPPAYRMEP